MDDQTPNNEAPASKDMWQEVGKQFQMLGDSLSAGLQAAAGDPQHHQRAQEMQNGLEALLDEFSQVVQAGTASLKEAGVGDQARKAAETLRDASEQTVQEVRPQLISALRQVNSELQKWLDSLQKNHPA